MVPLKKSDKHDRYDPVFLFLTFSGQRREGSKYSTVIFPQYFPLIQPPSAVLVLNLLSSKPCDTEHRKKSPQERCNPAEVDRSPYSCLGHNFAVIIRKLQTTQCPSGSIRNSASWCSGGHAQ